MARTKQSGYGRLRLRMLVKWLRDVGIVEVKTFCIRDGKHVIGELFELKATTKESTRSDRGDRAAPGFRAIPVDLRHPQRLKIIYRRPL